MRTFVNVLTNWATFVLATAITFFLSPFVVHHLGTTRYGLWAVAGSLVGYLGLLDLGIRVGVTRFVAQHEATGDREAANRLITTSLGLFAVIGVAAIVIGAVFSGEISRLVHAPGAFLREVQFALLISSVTVAVSLISGAYGAILAGLQRFALLNLIDLSAEILRAAGTVFALSRGQGLIALAAIQLVTVCLRAIGYLIATRRLQPWLTIARRFYDRVTRIEIIKFSTYTTLLHISAFVLFSSDALVIAAIMPVSQVAFFVIAGNLTQAALQVLGGVSRALYPLISARQATAGIEGTKHLIRNSVRISTIIVLPVVFTFLARGRTFIGLWMGPEYADLSGEILEILAAGLCVFASYQVLSISIMALALHRGLVPAYLGESVANIGLSFLLGSMMGVAGVAWGTTIPRIVVAMVFAPWFCRKKLNLSIREYATHAWLRPLVSLLPFGVLSVILDRTWRATTLITFFSQVALLLPVAALGIWVAGLEPEEREQIRSRFRSARAQLGWSV